jgi:hypothetical protein
MWGSGAMALDWDENVYQGGRARALQREWRHFLQKWGANVTRRPSA